MIENLREQKEREERDRLEELEQTRRENQELKDKLSALQTQKVSQCLPASPGPNQSQRPDGEVSMGILMLHTLMRDVVLVNKAVCVLFVPVWSEALVIFLNVFLALSSFSKCFISCGMCQAFECSC